MEGNMHHPEEKPTPPARKHVLGPSEIFGQNVHSGRKKIGLTQEEFAKRVNLTLNEVRDIENGDGKPDLGEEVRIAVALGTEVYILFTPKHRS